MKYKYFLIIILFGIIGSSISCKSKDSKHTKDQAIVKVYGKYLYKDDISKIVSPGTSEEDSTNIIQTYINSWIQNQLLLHYAEEYLKDQKSEIDKKTEDFKNSLLIHQFKIQLVKVNSDSILNQSEIETYYNNHYNEFKLTNSIIRGFFVKVSNKSTGLDKFKQLLHTSNNRDIDAIISYVKTANGNYDNFMKDWSDFPSKIMKIPVAIDNSSDYLKNNRFIESNDKDYYYFLLISEYLEKGKVAPIEYAQESIVKILQKKQSNSILEKFEKEKYAEALEKGDIAFFE